MTDDDIRHFQNDRSILIALAGSLKCAPKDVPAKLAELKKKLDRLTKELEQFKKDQND